MWIKSDNVPEAFGNLWKYVMISYYSPDTDERVVEAFYKGDEMPKDAQDIYWHYVSCDLPWETSETLDNLLVKFINSAHTTLNSSMPTMSAVISTIYREDRWNVKASLTMTTKGGFILNCEVEKNSKKSYYSKTKEANFTVDCFEELLTEIDSIVEECEKLMVDTSYSSSSSSYSYESSRERSKWNGMEGDADRFV